MTHAEGNLIYRINYIRKEMRWIKWQIKQELALTLGAIKYTK